MRSASRWWTVWTVTVAAAIAAVAPGRPVFGEPNSGGSAQDKIPVPSDERTQPRKQTQPVPSPESIARWVAELDDARYAVRAEATRQLIDAREAAVGPLHAAALTGSPEATIRALAILEALYVTVDEQALKTSDLVELALERLAESPNGSAATRAVEVLERHDDVREIRAIASIRRLGGIVRLADKNRPQIPANQNGSSDGRRRIEAVIIPPQWKGGDDGLRHVKRLIGLPALYRITGSQVSDNGIRDVQTAIPNLMIVSRGPSSLGVTPSPISQNGDAWRVGTVDADSSAERGGIRTGDVISRFAGKDIPDFDTLIELIKKTKPGDEVTVVVQRQGGPVTLKVVMQEWRDAEK